MLSLTDELAQHQLVHPIYIILFAIFLVPISLFFFGAVTSHAQANGRTYGISWQVSGPAVALLGCVLLGYLTVPSDPKPPQEFTLTIDIVGTNGRLEPHAQVGLRFSPNGMPEILVPIIGTSATFRSLSPQLWNTSVYPTVNSLLYELVQPQKKLDVARDHATVSVKSYEPAAPETACSTRRSNPHGCIA